MIKLLILIVSVNTILVTGCSSWRSSGDWLPGASWIPGVYKIDVQQGNVVTQQDINKLKPGMSKRQVRFIMGTPMINDTFHKERWDYKYTFKPGRGEPESQLVTLYFENERIIRIEGDLRPQPQSEQVADSSDKETIVTINPTEKKKGWINRIFGTVGLGEYDD